MSDHRSYFDSVLGRTGSSIAEYINTDFYKDFYQYLDSGHVRIIDQGWWSGRGANMPLPLTPDIILSIMNAYGTEIDQALDRLLNLLARHFLETDYASLSAYLTGAKGRADSIAILLDAGSGGLNALAQKTLIDEQQLMFIITGWLKPLFTAGAAVMADAIDVDRLEPRCPLCGGHPDMAILAGSEDGRRYLHCSLCETTWPYKRMTCPICANEEYASMGYFSIESNPLVRIDYCDICNGYIKTLQVPRGEPLQDYDCTVENLLSIPGDQAIMQCGYRRP